MWNLPLYRCVLLADSCNSHARDWNSLGLAVFHPQDPVEAGGPRAPEAPDPTLLPGMADAGATPGVVSAGEDYASAAAATGLPELTIDLHVYDSNPAKRAVFINGHRYVRGARLNEGPLVEDITPDGALLSYRGRRFLLPRL